MSAYCSTCASYLKNGFGLSTELGRDDYVNGVVEKIKRIVNG